jgi:hypothetical protein
MTKRIFASGKDQLLGFAVVALMTIIAACGGGKAIIGNVVGTASQAFHHMSTSSHAGSWVHTNSSGNVFTSALFFAPLGTASLRPQSFMGSCTFANDPALIPAGDWIPFAYPDSTAPSDCNGFFSEPQPNMGTLIIKDGTLANLSVAAVTDTNQTIVVDTDNLVQDGITSLAHIGAWYQPSTGKVAFFNGPTQIGPSLTLVIPDGQIVVRLTEWHEKN